MIEENTLYMKEENNNYCVYQHVCPDGVYYGVTCNVGNRWQPSKYRGTSLEPYIDKYGWKNIKHEVVSENLTYEEAIKIEDELIVNGWDNGTCLNDRRSGHYQQTDEFREEQNARCKAWYEDNKEDKKAYDKAYYEEHKEDKKACSKAWRETNREEYNEYHKVYMRERRKRKKEENNNNDK